MHVGFDAPRRGEAMKISLAKWAASCELHAYYTVDVKGKSRWGSLYVYVPKGRGGTGGTGRSTRRGAPLSPPKPSLLTLRYAKPDYDYGLQDKGNFSSSP